MVALESLPLDLQRNFKLLREIDCKSNGMERTYSFARGISLLHGNEEVELGLDRRVCEVPKMGKLKDAASRENVLRGIKDDFDTLLKQSEEKIALATHVYETVCCL